MVVFIWHTRVVYSLVKPNFGCLTFHLHVCALLPPQNMDQSEHASQISSQRDLSGGSWLAESGGSGTKCERPPLLSLLLPPAEKGSSVWVCRLSQVSENHPAHTTVFKCPRLGVCFQSSCSVIELARRATDSEMLLTMSVKSCCLPILFPGKWRLLTRFLVAASYHIFVCVQKGRPVHAVAHFFIFLILSRTIRAHRSYQSLRNLFAWRSSSARRTRRINETHLFGPGTFCRQSGDSRSWEAIRHDCDLI